MRVVLSSVDAIDGVVIRVNYGTVEIDMQHARRVDTMMVESRSSEAECEKEALPTEGAL